MAFWDDLKSLFVGSPEQHNRVSTLRRSQEPIYKQLVNAAQRSGAGGAFGDAADYYRGLLSDDSADFDAFAAPELRRYREQIIPDLAEQFAGYGAGSLGSSGFRNAAVSAGTDLSERLGKLRADLRRQGAAGLQDIGQLGLGNYSQDVMTQQGTQGIAAPALGALGTAAFGPVGGAAGAMAGNWMTNAFGGTKVGKNSDPYGRDRTGGFTPPGSFSLPNFNSSMRR